MILQASYSEISDIIRKKSGHDVKICYIDNQTVRITVRASVRVKIIGPLSKTVSKSFSANLHLVGISGSTLTVDVDTGCLLNLVLSQVKSDLLSKAPEGLVESFVGNRAVLNLAVIPQTKSVFDNLDISSIAFAEETVYVDASLRV